MKKAVIIKAIVMLILPLCGSGQDKAISDTLLFKGQLSTWAHYNPSNDQELWLGGRYLPEANYQINLKNYKLIDFEVSANVFGTAGIGYQDSAQFDGKVKPYRSWARFSNEQFEFRIGLQKINFGSANILRPLMWFDQIDPRDPLQLTDGVWGILARYYFLNNANIWLWSLYGNRNPKGWESIKTNERFPELGGRIQAPVPHGEAGLSYNFRIADSRDQQDFIPSYAEIPEHKIGFDYRMDYILGAWFECSWSHKQKDIGTIKNLGIFNLGIDYTWGIGNGLYTIFEQLVFSADEQAFAFENTNSFSLLSASYPIGLFDNINAILYFNWSNQSIYNFINWQHDFNHLTLYLMAYWNPEDYYIPTQGTAENLYAGRGVQIMLVVNH